MTNKELAEWSRFEANRYHPDTNAVEHFNHTQTAEILESLVPRTEAPTVEEVNRNTQALHYYGNVNVFATRYGDEIRLSWQDGDRWLPLPQPKEME